MKQKVLVICPTRNDKTELARPEISGDNKIYFHDYPEDAFDRILASGYIHDFAKQNPQTIIDDLLEFCNKEVITGVMSSDDYPGSIYTSVIAQHQQLAGCLPEVILRCQHKFYSRQDQRNLVPHAVPLFCLVNQNSCKIESVPLPFPFFMKPVKSYFSYLAGKINHEEHLLSKLQSKQIPKEFLYQFNWFLKKFCFADISTEFLAEEILYGHQVTVEGYVYNGQCSIIGVTDSIMYPNTISFARFEYPSFLPDTVQQRMGTIAQELMVGIGFNNSLFNIEMMYNPITDHIFIIEVNSRMSRQFADLYEKVDGMSSYTIALDIATAQQPHIKYRNGQFKVAASCVMRLFENKRVVKVPTLDDIAQVKKIFPESRIYICVNEGELLSDQLQDGNSYLYCLIHLGARDQQELTEKFEYAKRLLPFAFQSV